MIPHSSAGDQPWGHPIRTFNGGPGRFDLAQMPGQYDLSSDFSQPPVLQPQPPPHTRQPAVIDLTANSFESQDSEPAPKRPRLDTAHSSNVGDSGPTVNSAEVRNTPASANSRPALSWRGRPLWSFQAILSENSGTENRGEIAASIGPASPPPFPVRPWSNAPPEPPQNTLSRSRETSLARKVQTTPYRIETPSVAPVLKGEKVADFTPWTGNHPEDVLNEQSTKQGYYDRTQVSQNESNTARPALYAQLKHRTGLQMLSSVFAAALEKRQSHNTVHAPSTFKPPPRVTLTDNKREAWLRDLANPSVPLRRLSRTIPHGIRGKVLLDQCLSKWIPVARAVWLSKCVGANEIRAFKRKGTSGAMAVGLEAKWVRDWTTNVQQFVEGVFSSPPKSTDWKARMTYAIGLTARLFFENLLDHDHFLEWFLASFEVATLSAVPVWLLMLGIYWNNLLRYRNRGRRLAEIVLEKLRQVHEANLESLKPIIDRLSRFIQKLIHEQASSMILPNSWDKYKEYVSSCLRSSNKLDLALFQSIAERNARVQRPGHSKQTMQHSSHQRILHLLDSMRSTHDISSISLTCLEVVDDKDVLVSNVLEWVATPFRHGICRIYIGVRLLRKWKSLGIDVDGYVLDFLSRANSHRKLNMGNIYHVVSELVRSQTFSVGRYLQWLMAKGVTSQSSGEVHDHPCDVGLIAQVPVSRLPEHISNLRNTLLARAGLSAEEEAEMIASIKASISQRLPAIFDIEMSERMPLDSMPRDLTWTIKAEIGQWLRRGVAAYTRDATSSTLRPFISVETGSVVCSLTPEEFYVVRDVLETFDDISILADVLKCASSSDDSIVLASVADTANCHFDSLSVIGATTVLFRKLVDSYAGIKRYCPPNLDLMFSLIELGMRVPSEMNTVSFLRQDLSRIENKSVLAASSPVSDHIPDSLSDGDTLFREKLDQLLSSGNVMDEPTLDSVFITLIKHLESDDGKTRLSSNDTCRYLSQLRSFQPKHFDGLLARWVSNHLRSADRTILLRVLPSLIGVGCVTIRSFLSLVKRLGQTSKAIPNAAELPADLIELLSPDSGEGSRYLDLVSYRFQLAQQEFLAKNSEDALGVVCEAAALLDAGNSEVLARHSALESSTVKLMCELLVREPERAARGRMQKLLDQNPTATRVVQKALSQLLDFDTQNPCSSGDAGSIHAEDSPKDSVISEVEKLANTTDDFSLPFCQLKLQVLFLTDPANEDRNSIVDAMFKTVVADSRAQKRHWVDLVALMSPDAVRQIRERAEKEFFAVPMLEDGSDSSGVPQTPQSLETAKLYLSIIEELASSIPDSGAPSVAVVLVEKMESLLHKVITIQANLDKAGEHHIGSANSQERINCDRGLAFWFLALLRMVVIYRASFTQTSTSLKVNETHERCRLLVAIFCIALSRAPGDALRQFPGAGYFPRPGPFEDSRSCPGILLQTHALDVAASLLDVLPDEIRHHCGRFLKEKCPPFNSLQNDPRLVYLLGPILDSHASTLVQSASAPSPAASASTPTPTSANNPAPGTIQPAASGLMLAGMTEGIDCMTSRLRLQRRGQILGPYPIRPWELLEDAAPFLGVNDTAVNLGYFDARRARV